MQNSEFILHRFSQDILLLYLFFTQKESVLQPAAAFYIKPNYMSKIW